MQDIETNSRLVYSTSQGKTCPVCSKSVNNCSCHQKKKVIIPEGDGVARLLYETKGRRGKGMTLITGLPLSEQGLLDLTKQLKQHFGTGGTVKEYTIELQGDHREQAALELRKLGFAVKI